MIKIVLTGGPCSGKTTTLRALRDEFGDQIELIPEVASMLLDNGFPSVNKGDVQWSPEWQAAFQAAIMPLQASMEAAYELKAAERGVKVLIQDRGLLDGAAYTPGGAAEFCRINNLDESETCYRYAAVIHLESLATAAPEKYGKGNNESRFEAVERAAELEKATWKAWERHPHHVMIDGSRGISEKVAQVVGIIRYLLAGG